MLDKWAVTIFITITFFVTSRGSQIRGRHTEGPVRQKPPFWPDRSLGFLGQVELITPLRWSSGAVTRTCPSSQTSFSFFNFTLLPPSLQGSSSVLNTLYKTNLCKNEPLYSFSRVIVIYRMLFEILVRDRFWLIRVYQYSHTVSLYFHKYHNQGGKLSWSSILRTQPHFEEARAP